jgi:hypothetical protein
MSTAKDLIVFFDSMANNVCATVCASWCERLDCAFEAIECVSASIHFYLERLVVIVPAGFAFRHDDLDSRIAINACANPRRLFGFHFL